MASLASDDAAAVHGAGYRVDNGKGPAKRSPAGEARLSPLGGGGDLNEVAVAASLICSACSNAVAARTRSARSPRNVWRIDTTASGALAAISVAKACAVDRSASSAASR